jgi:hypothetical protein
VEPASYITDEAAGFNLLTNSRELCRQYGAFNVEMGYLTVLHVRLGAKIGDWYAKDSNIFCKQLISEGIANRASTTSWRS